jgi:putative transposase
MTLAASTPIASAPLTSTSGCPVTNRRMIFAARRSICLINIPDTKLLATLDPALTSRGKDFYPFWKRAREDLYRRLWLPLKTDCVVSDSIYLHGSSKDMVSSSWFSNKTISLQKQKWQRTRLQSFKCSVVDGMVEDDTAEEEGEDEEETKQIRTRKVRLLPKKYQKRILNDWRHAARYSYNKAVFLMNETASYNKMYLRDLITPVEVNAHASFLLKTPKDIRAAAVFEATKNARACFTNLRQGNITHFRMGFRARKKEDRRGWCLGVNKKAIKVRGKRTLIIYGTYCPWEFETVGTIGEISKDCKIQFDGARYYLIIPYQKSTPKAIGQGERSLINEVKESVISLDPGIRTSQTAYSPSKVFKLGDGCATRLFSLAIQLDRLISFEKRIIKRHRRKKRAVRLRIIKVRKKLAHLRDELHYKTADFLTKKAKVIMLPEFKTSEMVKRVGRRIGSKTVRQMSFLSHYKFMQRLKAKAAVRGVTVLIVSEHYTSKTCGRCGHMKENLGSSKTLQRDQCLSVLDRDCNGARNILLRAMREADSSKDDCKMEPW